MAGGNGHSLQPRVSSPVFLLRRLDGSILQSQLLSSHAHTGARFIEYFGGFRAGLQGYSSLKLFSL